MKIPIVIVGDEWFGLVSFSGTPPLDAVAAVSRKLPWITEDEGLLY
jgi:hypothetical protein